MTSDLNLTTGALKGILSNKESQLYANKPIVAQVSNVKIIDHKDDQGQTSVRYRVLLNDGAYSLHGVIPSECVPYCESHGFKKTSVINIKKYELVTGQKHIMVIQDLEVKQASSAKFGGTLISVDSYYEEHPEEDTLELAKKQQQQQAVKSTSPPFDNTPTPATAKGHGNAVSPPLRHVNAIEQLSPYQNQWTIKARVSYKGDIRKWSNARGEGKLFNVNLLDESDEIRATAFNDMADKYFQELEEGKVYYVSKARIQQAKPQFSHLSHPYELSLDRDTIVEECFDVSSNDVPKINYNFVKLDQLQNIEPNSITDVIGVLQKVEPVFQITAKSTGKPFDRRNVTIVDDSNFAISVGLWNQTAVDFSTPEGSVVAFKGCKVSDFGGRSLSLTPGGSFITSPDTAEAFQLKGWYDNKGKNETYQTMKSEAGAGSNSLSSDRKTILQAQDENLGLNEKPDFFNIKATISFLKTNDGNFCYPSCNNDVNGSPCNRKVVDTHNDGWRCERCDITFAEPEYRYILNISVMDSTGQLWMTLFDKEANTLLGLSANELRKLKEQSDNNENAEFQQVIEKVTMKEYSFRVKARQDSYNGVTRIRYQGMAISPVDFSAECDLLCKELDSMLA
ncbi:replication factor A protein 1 [[Candida] railenensis]|uniref:Replication protein A subunit n=1 Tax=[Candida] railenensis TaxID=45579 RepID=A0A9P0W0H2_9ASCO|nr:replication factor A protein 1 [[Candida] railenensis]